MVTPSALNGMIAHGVITKDRVLMLENRSFDLDTNGTPVVVWNSPGTDETTMRIPNPDPGELWTDINMQLFGNSAPALGQRPTMVGFVQNYLAQQQLNPQQTCDPKSVMHYFAPAQLPVLSQLAQQFAVFDHWFASAPLPDLAQPLVRPCRHRRRP
jgi:phospholipase C